MQRRTILQAIAAFFASIFYRVTRLGRRTAELPARVGWWLGVSPNARWRVLNPPVEVQVTLRVEESKALPLLDHPWATYQDGVLSHPGRAVMEVPNPAANRRVDISNDEAYMATMESSGVSREYTQNRMAALRTAWDPGPEGDEPDLKV